MVPFFGYFGNGKVGNGGGCVQLVRGQKDANKESGKFWIVEDEAQKKKKVAEQYGRKSAMDDFIAIEEGSIGA